MYMYVCCVYQTYTCTHIQSTVDSSAVLLHCHSARNGWKRLDVHFAQRSPTGCFSLWRVCSEFGAESRQATRNDGLRGEATKEDENVRREQCCRISWCIVFVAVVVESRAVLLTFVLSVYCFLLVLHSNIAIVLINFPLEIPLCKSSNRTARKFANSLGNNQPKFPHNMSELQKLKKDVTTTFKLSGYTIRS